MIVLQRRKKDCKINSSELRAQSIGLMHRYFRFCPALCALCSKQFGSAQNKTRTCTPLPAPAPQAGVSTNFTIWAVFRLRAKGSALSAKQLSFCSVLCALCPVHYGSAQNRTRTCTSFLTLVPETSASTNFAIWAFQ